MRSRLLLVPTLLGLVVGCGGGDESEAVDPPTLTQVAPATGPTGGGTAIVLTGTGFFDPAIVTIDGSGASSVTVVSPRLISCVTPPGAAGSASVQVTTDAGVAVLAAGFTYEAGPGLTSVAPASGPFAGGTAVTLTGSGFSAPASVTVGGLPLLGATVVDETTITGTTPPHPAGPADVVVTLGTTVLALPGAYAYTVPLFAADGKGGVAGNLWSVDSATGAATAIGPIGFAVTGLAWDPVAQVLYGATSAREASNGVDANGNVTAQLLTIDTATGAGTAVGPLVDPLGNGYVVGDLDWLLGVLVGLVAPAGTVADVVGISPLTGSVVASGTGFCSSGGCPYGMALSSTLAGALLLAPDGGQGQALYRLNPVTSVPEPVPGFPALTGGLAGGGFPALSFGGGTLFALEHVSTGSGTPGVATNLVRIDLVTGAIATVGPTAASLDALVATSK
jgi:hypothetical protein